MGLGLSGVNIPAVPEEEGISMIKYAFSKGITFFDTADVYGPFTNEVLVGKVCDTIKLVNNLKWSHWFV